MLKVKIMQFENVVVMKILEQSYKDTEALKYRGICLNGIKLRADEFPDIASEHEVYFIPFKQIPRYFRASVSL